MYCVQEVVPVAAVVLLALDQLLVEPELMGECRDSWSGLVMVVWLAVTEVGTFLLAVVIEDASFLCVFEGRPYGLC